MARRGGRAKLGRMRSAHDLGRAGETLAAEWLESRGWLVLNRGFRLGHKEIDIIARRGEVVAFIEVKTRASRGFGHPLAAITAAKRREIAQVAAAWIDRHASRTDTFRFDAIAILYDGAGPPSIEHVEDAWRL
jgi:putative endonuclease